MSLIAFRHNSQRGIPHLRVKQTRYSDDMKLKLQRVGSPARWLPGESAWSYPLSAAAVIALDKAARDAGETVEWKDGLKEFAEQHLKQAEREHEVRLAIERIIQDKLPLDGYVTRLEKPNGEPIPPLRHQQVSYHWSQRVSGLYLAHDPGLGKSRSATDASGGWYRNNLIRPMTPITVEGKPGVEGGVLIVCPKTMLRTWQEELAFWQSASGILILGSSTKKTQLAGTPAHYHVVNYEALRYVEHNRYDGLIADEIHKCANHSKQSVFVQTLAQRTRKRLGLSGTPVTNSLESVFYQMLIIDGGRSLGASKTAFLEKYFKTIMVGAGFTKHDPLPESAAKISAAMAESTYFVKKEEVLPDLPLKTHSPRYLEMTPEQERYYKQIKNETITYIQDTTVTIEQASARMSKLLQICQGFVLTDDGNGEGRHFSDAKNAALMDMLTDSLRERKVVVWGYFSFEIERLSKSLSEAGIRHIRIDGSIKSQRDRDMAMHAWNNDPSIKVYIRQLSMSEGVTLHAKDCAIPCFDTVYLTLSYKRVDYIQSQDRIHRIGQEYPCNYVYLLTENGIDRKVYQSLIEKTQTADMVTQMGKSYYLKLLTTS